MKDIYIAMIKLLRIIRDKHPGVDCDEEDKLLDIMDSVWWELTQEEIDEINKLPSYSIIKEKKKMDHHNMGRRIRIKVIVNGFDSGLYFVYDVDNSAPLAPQIELAVNDSKSRDISEAMRDIPEITFVGVVER